MKSNTVKLAFVAAVQFCALIFRKKMRVLSVALCALGIGLPASAQTYAIFDPPGAVVTGPQDINPAGTIAGTFFDGSGAFHGFLRLPDGTITTFDVAGAVGTGGNRINPAGLISGIYIDGSGMGHGFVRDPDGTFITYDAPGLGSTILNPPGISVNPAGTVAGTYSDAAGVRHGFVRTADGTITTFDGPGAAAGTGRWKAINRGVKTAPQEVHFDPEDFKYVATAANTSCRVLVAHDDDYSADVRKILTRKLSVTVTSAAEAHG